jgi:two-component system KDP operon response regulator KdpE
MREAVRILVVDDAEPVRVILLHALRLRGFEVEQAECGAAALRQVLAAPPDIAIVDQWMPEMSGSEVIARMRASLDPRVRAVPVIGLSGRAGSERELVAAGALTFLPKPFGAAQLDAALCRALGALGPAPEAGTLPADASEASAA